MAYEGNNGQHEEIPSNPQELQGQRTKSPKGANTGYDIGQEAGSARNMRVPKTPGGWEVDRKCEDEGHDDSEY